MFVCSFAAIGQCSTRSIRMNIFKKNVLTCTCKVTKYVFKWHTYVLKSISGTFVKTACLRAGAVFLGTHARANIWHCFDLFLHFVVFTWYENTIGNTNLVVVRVWCMTLNPWVSISRPGAYTSKRGAHSGQAGTCPRAEATACIASSWPTDTALDSPALPPRCLKVLF